MNKVVEMGMHQFKEAVMKDAENRKVIRTASIEILDTCNYMCKHCYVHGTYKNMILWDDYVKVVDQLYNAGCKWLILTGGEPLLHRDFEEIYTYAYQRGFFVTLFSNAYGMTQNYIELLKKYPPYELEVSLYGYDEESYDNFVGVKGSFPIFDRNLNLLLQNGISFTLKATITTKAYSFLALYEDYARRKGVTFRYDSLVVSKLDGDPAVCEDFRLSPEKALAIDLRKEKYIKKSIQEFDRIERSPIDNRLYICDAGLNSVFVDATLKMSYCVLVRSPSYDLKGENATIEDGHQWLIQKRNAILDSVDQCYDCTYKNYCRYCPGRFYLETRDERVPPDWNCKYGAMFYAEIMKRRANNCEYK